MKALRLAAGFTLILGLAGCGGTGQDTVTATVMPDVIGRQLDVALSDIKSAGFEDKVEVIGGGTFGVVNESNWQVCHQLPAAGQSLTAAPKLTVDRSCGDGLATDPSTTVLSTTTTAALASTTVATQPVSTAVATTKPPVAATTRATTATTTGVTYANCTAVKAAGKAPIRRGQPGYSTDLDRDGDGIACET